MHSRAERARATPPVGQAAPRSDVSLLALQRTAGNRAVVGLLARRRQLQRLIATEDQPKKTLFVPQAVVTGGQAAQSLKSLLGSEYRVEAKSPDDFLATVAPGWTADESDAEAKAALERFNDPQTVHHYSRLDTARWEGPDRGSRLLLNAHDMSEAPDPLGKYDKATGCVIQALESVGQDVPGGKGARDVRSWHAYCEKATLDYRTDNQIARLYVGTLGYTLVNNTLKRWRDVNWAALGDGTYLASTYPTGAPASESVVGHMIAVEVKGGAVTKVHDQQGVTAPELGKPAENVHVRYIYKRPK